MQFTEKNQLTTVHCCQQIDRMRIARNKSDLAFAFADVFVFGSCFGMTQLDTSNMAVRSIAHFRIMPHQLHALIYCLRLLHLVVGCRCDSRRFGDGFCHLSQVKQTRLMFRQIYSLREMRTPSPIPHSTWEKWFVNWTCSVS